MKINHFDEARTAYDKYLARKKIVDDFEKDVIGLHNDNVLLAKLDLKQQQFFELAAKAKDRAQHQAQTEALMAIMISLERIVTHLEKLLGAR